MYVIRQTGGATMSRGRNLMLLCIAALLLLPSLKAAVVTNLLGEQDFANGKSPIFSAEIAAAGIGEPFPFDGTSFGSDPGGVLGEFQYTHSFSVGALVPAFATLTIGLIDHDSFTTAQDTIDLFFDGIQQDDMA